MRLVDDHHPPRHLVRARVRIRGGARARVRIRANVRVRVRARVRGRVRVPHGTASSCVRSMVAMRKEVTTTRGRAALCLGVGLGVG